MHRITHGHYYSIHYTILQLQRIGRTGRKRESYVHILLSADREERNLDKANDNYKEVQRFIIEDNQLELYDDVELLIPKHIKPECVEMVMNIEEYAREEKVPRLSKAGKAKAKRAVRNDNVTRNIPSGATTTFVSGRDLLQEGSSKSRKRKKGVSAGEFDEQAGEDGSDDMEITAGVSASPRRILCTPQPASSSKAQGKKKMRWTVTPAAAAGESSSGGKSQG